MRDGCGIVEWIDGGGETKARKACELWTFYSVCIFYIDCRRVQCLNVITKSAKRSAKMFTMIEILHYISLGSGNIARGSYDKNEYIQHYMNQMKWDRDDGKRPNFELNKKIRSKADIAQNCSLQFAIFWNVENVHHHQSWCKWNIPFQMGNENEKKNREKEHRVENPFKIENVHCTQHTKRIGENIYEWEKSQFK